jgi:hypothetical protein
MRITRLVALIAPLLVLGPSQAPARSTFAQATLDRYFKIDWQVVRGPRGPVIEGFVYNRFGQATDQMRLSIEHLDAAGNIVGDSTTWVMGGVPGNNRTWFTTPVPEASSYRVEILSFNWVSRGQ